MHKHLKLYAKFIRSFVVVVTKSDRLENASFKKTLESFENIFGAGFWQNVAIVCTRYGHKLFKNTTKSTKDIRETLNKLFPASKGHALPCFYTDYFDLEDRKKDKTRSQVKELLE
jgi:GTP-binding protein EngB required for normal cell division